MEGALIKWRGRNIPENCLSDIYDGAVWKTFKDVNGQYFFQIGIH